MFTGTNQCDIVRKLDTQVPQKELNSILKIMAIKNKTTNWKREGLVYGITMFIIMSVIYPLVNSTEITLKSIWIEAIIWIVAGQGFGLTMNYLNRRIKKR